MKKKCMSFRLWRFVFIWPTSTSSESIQLDAQNIAKRNPIESAQSTSPATWANQKWGKTFYHFVWVGYLLWPSCSARHSHIASNHLIRLLTPFALHLNQKKLASQWSIKMEWTHDLQEANEIKKDDSNESGFRPKPGAWVERNHFVFFSVGLLMGSFRPPRWGPMAKVT